MADDIELLGLRVSPDLDSILYTLTGRSDDERGWGRADESWRALETVTELGGEDWFRLGDRDIGLHLVRTELLRSGASLSEATAQIARALGLEARLLPATDDPVRTFLETPAGTFAFQTWFVARGHRDEVDAVHYAGAPEAAPAPGVLDALRGADVILIAPSNPYVSIGPILAVAEIRAAARGAERLLRRGQPARRRARSERTCRPHARPSRRRHDARARRVVLRGPHRRARASTSPMRRPSCRTAFARS